MAMPKQIKKVIRDAERLGWTVEKARSGHLRWLAPDGTYRFGSSCSPTDPDQAAKSIKGNPRRHGVEL